MMQLQNTGVTMIYIPYALSKQVLELNGDKFRLEDKEANTVNGKTSKSETKIKSQRYQN